MCSWCWAFRPTLATLREELPLNLEFKSLLGGLAPDSATPMPEDMQHYLQQTWHRIQQRVPDTYFNFDFWSRCQPRRSTYPACRAVIAARKQNPAAEDAMVLAIQRAYYTQARNPSLLETLIELSVEIGLDPEKFGADLTAPQIESVLRAEIAEARSLGIASFPGLVLMAGETRWPITVDYSDARPMLEQVNTLIGKPVDSKQ